MGDFLSLAAANILSPPVLFFALGLLAALGRSDLSIPEAVAKGLSIYLLMAIGFKGGAEVVTHRLDLTLLTTIIASIALSFTLPGIAYLLLRQFTQQGA